MTRSRGFWLAVVASLVVAGAVGAGLLAVGGPGAARLEKLDRERTEDLRAIEDGLARRWERTGRLPRSLDSLGAAEGVLAGNLTDPATGERYAYRVLSDSTYALCATFARASDGRTELAYGLSGIGPHGAGRHCFTLHPERSNTR